MDCLAITMTTKTNAVLLYVWNCTQVMTVLLLKLLLPEEECLVMHEAHNTFDLPLMSIRRMMP